MALFAFVFRTTRPLTPPELAERARVVPAWMLQQREAGRVAQVCVFGEEAAVLGPDDEAVAAGEGALAGCTLVEARDIADALALARRFPGRRFGTAIEVRPVKTFVGPPPAPLPD